MRYTIRVLPEQLYIIGKHSTRLTFISMSNKDSDELRLLDKPSIGHGIYLILLSLHAP